MNKKVKKILLSLLVLIAALILLVIIVFSTMGNSLIRKGVVVASESALKVDCDLQEVDLSLLKGSLKLAGLKIGNPEGYNLKDMMVLDNASVKLNTSSLFSDTIVIENINLDGLHVTLEQKGFTNNLQDIMNNLPKVEEAEVQEDESEGKNLKITKLTITNVTVTAKLLPVPGKVDAITFKLPTIEMDDIGGKEQNNESNVDLQTLIAEIISAITDGIMQSGDKLLPDDMLKGLEDFAGDTGKLMKEGLGQTIEQTQKLGDGLKDAGKDIGDGLKGIFGGKKEDN